MIRNQFRAFGPVRAACALAAVTGLTAMPAGAQSLEEVVVTAERREMALQDTPISDHGPVHGSAGAQGHRRYRRRGAVHAEPRHQRLRGYGNNQPTFSIRGISGGGGATSERGVALYIDGIYVPRTNGSVFKVFDIERIEVLRGPQGTLFGRNSKAVRCASSPGSRGRSSKATCAARWATSTAETSAAWSTCRWATSSLSARKAHISSRMATSSAPRRSSVVPKTVVGAPAGGLHIQRQRES